MQLRAFRKPLCDMWHLEDQLKKLGYCYIAGIDEAGRGTLAGPVVAAAVVLPYRIDGVKDSKQLSPTARERICEEIQKKAVDIGIGCVEAEEIDRINILRATFRAMLLAINNLARAPDFLLIDGPYRLPLPVAQKGIRGGDRVSASVAAASIVAKVHRDRLMARYHYLYPQYGFEKNKGYATAYHRMAIARYGPCPIHRRTFRGVAEFIEDPQGPEHFGKSPCKG